MSSREDANSLRNKHKNYCHQSGKMSVTLYICIQNLLDSNLGQTPAFLVYIYSGFRFLLFFLFWLYYPLWVCILQPSRGVIAASLMRFLDHIQRRTTVGRNPLDE